ncbi:hypothetical protein PENANT_c034G08455 [Penicillium antarcticum]|uniref:Uncharacterized protein n=1 Tax=Penicillium antarcticum TaxID=416450 RepID=A0A1V6PV26_9EURO|nr:hypothetical protein PENANT_c034G08455 [Penicillium antarcticum]
MVTLNHQNFWQPPTTNTPQRCPSICSETQTVVVTEQLNTSGGSREGGYYRLENNVPQEEHMAEDVAAEIGWLPPSISPDVCQSDASAADNYPEEVALYPSSRVSSTPSVTGLDGPGTTRVFDVFEDDHTRQCGEHNHSQLPANGRERAWADISNSSPKRHRYHESTAMNAAKPRGRRGSQPKAESPSFESEERDADNHLAGLGNAIRYLKRFYSLATAEAKFSDNLADADILKENLSVLQLATKTLQHAYGIIATSTTALEHPVRQATTVQARQTITRRKWSVEDDNRLVKLRDSQKLPWSRIRDLFPGRTLGAVKQRYVRETSKQTGTPPSTKDHSNPCDQHVKCTSNIRRSQRLGRPHQIKYTRSGAEGHRRYPSRAAKHSGDLNALGLDSIDPRLRNLGNT